MDATESLLDGRDFEGITVLEICNAAEVSASSFYARFESKERLLAVMHDQHLAHRREQIRETVEALLDAGLAVAELIEAAGLAYVTELQADTPLLQTFRQAEIHDPALADRRASLDRFALEQVEEALLTLIDSPDEALRRRVRFGVRSACATLLESVQPPYTFSENMQLDVTVTVHETTRMFMSYVFTDDGGR